MVRRTGLWILRCGIVLAALGVVGAIVLTFQPWRSCLDDDTAAGCPMLTRDAAFFTAAMLSIATGVIVMIIGAVIRLRRS